MIKPITLPANLEIKETGGGGAHVARIIAYCDGKEVEIAMCAAPTQELASWGVFSMIKPPPIKR